MEMVTQEHEQTAADLYVRLSLALSDEVEEAERSARTMLARLVAGDDPQTVWREIAKAYYGVGNGGTYVEVGRLLADAYAAWERERGRVLANPFNPGVPGQWWLAERLIESAGEAIPFATLALDMKGATYSFSSAQVADALVPLANANDGWCPFRAKAHGKVAYGIREMREGEEKPVRGWSRFIDSFPGA